MSDPIRQLGWWVDQAIQTYCGKYLKGPAELVKAMRYSLQSGGKRIRPVLTLLACQACGKDAEAAMAPAVAIEVIHAFSLIHDDLPAMDNDDLRRGKPTCHRAFGEDMAILAGDGLLIFAFELLAREVTSPAVIGPMVAALAEAAGPAGMTGGQALDIRHTPQGAHIDAVEQIHRLKTAAMIRAAVHLGALAAEAEPPTLAALDTYGWNVGLAFQIVDDLLDVAGETDQVGKRIGKDAEAGKPNYAVLVGADRARARAGELIDEAVRVIGPLGPPAEPLAQLARMILNRSH